MHGEYGELRLAAVEHRLRLPHLSFYVSERDGRTLIRGRFAPRLEVWTFVWIVYLAMSFTAFFGLVLANSRNGCSANRSGDCGPPWPRIAISTLYVVANIGSNGAPIRWMPCGLAWMVSWSEPACDESFDPV